MRNYLIDGGSCTGKTSVCAELRRRGFHAINGDSELAYHGNPETGEPLPRSENHRATHENHLWEVTAVHTLLTDRTHPSTFFCGGSRNRATFVDFFDAVVVLRIDRATLLERLDERLPDDFGGQADERDLILRLHDHVDVLPPTAVVVDATVSLADVVDDILRRTA
ncbi:AAA family ATPase [Williamsia sterculiae]|uniref:Broad-specificity NMP kinase n=1 Tax=Williamsia sterculiae TaxID=1344003 RepID=A0A1N7EQL5_9NOCA|nr:AAA family ATPase [Williamsia sterculiae]SIR90245.1 hypothetical protein SAMN05445060_1563 [Williamsia sterculiae]